VVGQHGRAQDWWVVTVEPALESSEDVVESSDVESSS
jgi:hypothetical protein